MAEQKGFAKKERHMKDGGGNVCQSSRTTESQGLQYLARVRGQRWK